MATSIYGLVDPLTDEIRYIGKTVQALNSRLQNHLTEVRRNSRHDHKTAWIRSLLEQGKLPSIVLIETCPDEEWEERERYWIAYYREHSRLTNYRDGGQSPVPEVGTGSHRTPETRQLQSERAKEVWSNPERYVKHAAHLDQRSALYAQAEPRATIDRLLLEGVPAAEVVRQTGAGAGWVYRRREALDTPLVRNPRNPDRKRVSTETITEVDRLLLSGMAPQEVANRLNLNPTTVYGRRKRLGTPLPHPENQGGGPRRSD